MLYQKTKKRVITTHGIRVVSCQGVTRRVESRVVLEFKCAYNKDLRYENFNRILLCALHVHCNAFVMISICLCGTFSTLTLVG